MDFQRSPLASLQHGATPVMFVGCWLNPASFDMKQLMGGNTIGYLKNLGSWSQNIERHWNVSYILYNIVVIYIYMVIRCYMHIYIYITLYNYEKYIYIHIHIMLLQSCLACALRSGPCPSLCSHRKRCALMKS